jgi:hypothetical protein
MVKQVSTPGSNTRRFTLDSGFDATKFAAITAGDKVLTQQSLDYTANSNALDFIGSVSAKGANYLDITLPSSASTFIGTASLALANNFPIWIDRHNGISYVLDSNYWAPRGFNYWAYWLYMHLNFKINLLPASSAPTVTMQYKTPISKDYVSNILSLVNNSDGNCQIYSALKSQDQSFEGQALKLKMSGVYLGHEWMLQSLLAYHEPQNGDQLMIFEG